MIKVKLTNRLRQALPVLIKDLDDPKNLRQISIPKKRSKLIKEEELSVHCQGLYEKGYLVITRVGTADSPITKKAPVKVEEKVVPTMVAAPVSLPKATKKSSRSRKKGKK